MKFVFCLILALWCPAYAQAHGHSPRLTQATACMLKVLKATPGVSEPRLGSTTSRGVTYVFIEYRAAEASSWKEPTRFVLQPSGANDIWFLGLLPGMMPVDLHVTEVIVKKWKTQCGVEAVVETV